MLPDLAFRITAQAATAAAFAKTRADVAGIRGEVTRLGAQARAVFASFGASLGIAALMQIPRVIGEIASRGAGLQVTADKIGVTVEELQKLRYAGQLAEVEAGQVDEAFAKFSKTMGDASRGGADEFRKALELNGIALFDSEGKLRSVMDVAMEYADVIKNARNEQDRNVLSTIAFGKKNDELGQIFRDGAAGMKAAGDELERINGVTSATDVQKLSEIDAAYDKLSATFSHLQDAAVVGGVGTIQNFIDKTNALGEAADDFFANPNARNLMRFLFGEGAADALTPTEQPNSAAKGDRTVPSITVHPAKPSVAPPVKSGKSDADREREKIQGVIDALTLEHENLTRNARDQEIYNALARAGTDINSARGKEIASLAGQIYDESLAITRATDQMDALRDAAKDVLGGFIGDLRQGTTLADALGNALQRVADRVIDSSLDKLLDGIFGASGSNRSTSSDKGGIAGTIAAFAGKLFGFADGGSFRVGGSGGTDSQLVAFKASPDERVTVDKRGRSAAGGMTIVNNNTFNNVDPASRAWLTADLDRRDRANVSAAVAAILKGHSNNPGFFPNR